MSAEVETMFSVREKPWHGLGVIVDEAPNSAEALRLSGLDWTVGQRELQTVDGLKIPNAFANIRDTDNSVYGIVTERYKVVQNTEAFDFTDSLIGGDVRYETAGSLFGGRKVFLLAKMPPMSIVGDEIEPYMVFTNSFDGKGAVQVAMTPIRVVCNNTLNLALSTATKHWSARHCGDMNRKMEEAKKTLGLAEQYLEALDRKADKLVNVDMTDAEMDKVIEVLFPIDTEKMSQRAIDNADCFRAQLRNCMNAPDIAKFRNTQWGFINGVADFMGHSIPNRQTTTFAERRMDNIIGGETIVDKAMRIMKIA